MDEVLPEPAGGNNWAPLEAGQTLKAALERHLGELLALSEQDLRNSRYKVPLDGAFYPKFFTESRASGLSCRGLRTSLASGSDYRRESRNWSTHR